MGIEIRPLSPALEADFLGFFDRDAFADNPEWSRCYCRFAPFCGTVAEWEANEEKNRDEACAAVRAGEARGYLAYAENKPVGWVQAGRASGFPALKQILGAAPPDETGVVTCFVIAKPYRRQGIARQLLERAVRDLRAENRVVEAYPAKKSDDDAHAYPGPLELYISTGFVKVGELARRWIVRRELT
jgi:ribosomal protein S18 acetylase RimI-like enzyme